jgi:hypothetical protein
MHDASFLFSAVCAIHFKSTEVQRCQVTARLLVVIWISCWAKFLLRKQLYDARNRPTDATVHIDSWVVASYRTCDDRSIAPNQL